MAVFTGSLGTQYTLQLTVTQGTQNIPANTTQCPWSLVAIKNSGSGYFSGSPTSWSANIGGVAYSGTLSSYDFTGTSSITIASGTATVAHNADGTKTAAVTGTWNADNPPQLAPGTASGSLVLTRIPRGPKVEFNGAWVPSIVYVEFNGAWVPALMYAEFSGAWAVVA